MAAITTSEIAGQTFQESTGLFNAVSSALRTAQGFLVHVARPVNGRWRGVEIRRGRNDAARFLATTIGPQRPEGTHPTLSFSPMHDVLQR